MQNFLQNLNLKFQGCNMAISVIEETPNGSTSLVFSPKRHYLCRLPLRKHLHRALASAP